MVSHSHWDLNQMVDIYFSNKISLKDNFHILISFIKLSYMCHPILNELSIIPLYDGTVISLCICIISVFMNISIANALEILQSCTKPSMCVTKLQAPM